MRALAMVLLVACGSRDPTPERQPDPGFVPPAEPLPAPKPPPFEIAAPADPIVALGRGARHACVVRVSGGVDCWGQHERCKDCDLQPPPDARVRRVLGVDDAIAISEDARCVIRKPGTVACLAPDRLELVALPGITNARALDPASRCFVDGGGVRCLDGDDQLAAVPNVRDAIAVVSAEYIACAVRKTGDVMCGEPNERAPWRPLLGQAKIDQLVIGGSSEPRACVRSGGAVRCFTLASVFEAGPYRTTAPEELTAFRGATHLALRFDYPLQIDGRRMVLEALVDGKVLVSTLEDGEHAVVPVLADAARHVLGCAVRTQGSVVCWGSNEGGALARPTTINTAYVPPTPVVGLRDVVDVALATTKSYALTRDGRVYAWGGTRRWSFSTRPEPVPLGLGPQLLVQIGAAPDGLACMRSAAGEVWCQLDLIGQFRIEQLDTEAVQSIAVTTKAVLAVRADGRGELHALQGFEDVPMLAVELPRQGDVVELAGTYYRTCARTRDGSVGCPEPVVGIEAASAIVVGDDFGCAIQRGVVACWHYEESYAREVSHPATQVAGIRDATDLAASSEYACAVHGGGRIACWHFGKDGAALTPVEVLAGGAVRVELGAGAAGQLNRSMRQLHGPAPGGEYGCAIMQDRTVQCWGMHLFGELGDGSFVESASPIGVVL